MTLNEVAPADLDVAGAGTESKENDQMTTLQAEPTQAEKTSDRDAHAEYVKAGLALANGISIQRKIDTDPNFPADRSARADKLRRERLAADLGRFDAAAAAFMAEVTA